MFANILGNYFLFVLVTNMFDFQVEALRLYL